MMNNMCYFVLPIRLSSMVSLAEPSGDGQGRGPQGGKPPQEAFDACQDSSSGDACEVLTRRGDKLTGQCLVPPRGEEEVLLCVPDGMRKRT